MGLVTKFDHCAALAALPYWLALRNRQQWLSSAQLAEQRRRRLASLFDRAARAPYYARLFADLKLHLDSDVDPQMALGRLPLLDKQILGARSIDDFLTVSRQRLMSITTSGSTGRPTRFMRSAVEEAESSARWWRVYAAYGCSGFDRQVNIASAGKKDRAGPVGLLRRWGLLPNVIHIAATAPPAQNAAVFHAEKPRILAGHAIGIEALADHLLATGASVHPPRVVICAAMDVTEHCLQLAERALHAPAANVYVTNELGVVGWACPQRRDVLHINEDAFILEILDAQGQPAAPGVTGEIVITSLVHRSMPLIRYRIGDRGARLSEPCVCGRAFGLMTPVQGRTAHTITHPSGWLVTAPSIASAFSRAEAYAWVRRLQVHEEEGEKLRVLLEVRHAPSENERARLLEYLRDVTRRHYEIALDIVREIPPAPNGKHQYVVPMQSSTAKRASAA